MALTVTVDAADAYFRTRRPARYETGGKGWKTIDDGLRGHLIAQARDELQLTQGRILADPTDPDDADELERDDFAVYEQAYWIALREVWPTTATDQLAIPRGRKSKARREARTEPDIAPSALQWLRIATHKIVRG